MTGAWIGLLGVLVGGVMAFGARYILDWRREQAIGRAARVVMASELDEAAEAVRDALSAEPKPHWPPGWHSMGWSESWSMHRPVLAATMSRDDFDTLARARLQMQLLQNGLTGGERDFNERDEEFLKRVKAALEAAKKLLERLNKRRARTSRFARTLARRRRGAA